MFRVVLIGAGDIAEAHVKALRTIPGAELTAICDRDGWKARRFRETWEIPEAFESTEEMLRSTAPDVAHILTPPPSHAPLAIQCLESGCHVFIEKPMAISASECRTLGEAAHNARRRIAVNHNLMFQPGMLRLLEAIRNRRLGRVEHIWICYNMPIPQIPAGHFLSSGPGNLVFELGPHPVSVIHRILGDTVSAAALCSGKRALPAGGVAYHTWQATLMCERGTAQIYLSTNGDFPDLRVHVVGEDGAATWDFRRNTVVLHEKTPLILYRDNLRDCTSAARALVRDGMRNFRREMLGALSLAPLYNPFQDSTNASTRAFYAALDDDDPLPHGFEAGARVVAACEQIVRSGLANTPAGELAQHG